MKPGTSDTQLNDFEILDRVLAGDVALYEIIIRRYNPLLYKIGRSYGIRHEDVQDLMQETFIAAYENLRQFRRNAQLATWLTRIMINKCLYKMKTGSKYNLGIEDEIPYSYSSSVKLGQFPLQNELKKIIESALEKLPEHYRLVFLLRETENFSVEETAEALGITEVNVKVRLNRAKTMLREYLEQWYTKADIYEFHLKYCNSVTSRVMKMLANIPPL